MTTYHLVLIRLLLVMSIAVYTQGGWCQQSSAGEQVEAPFDEEGENELFQTTIADTPTRRMVPDSVPERLKNEKEFAYANDPSLWTKKQKKAEDNSSGMLEGIARFLESKQVRYFFYLLVILAVIWIIYRLVVVNSLFVFNSRKKDHAHDLEDEIALEGNIRERIDAAVRNGDYRLATRLLYIDTLQWLDQLQLIRYKADSTNQEYVQQMDRTPRGRAFRQLTRVFDYVWYGQFPVSREKFEVIRENFKSFNKSAGH